MTDVRVRRRAFLAAGAAALGAARWAGAAGAGEKLRIGVVGAGNRGAVDTEELVATGRVEVAALCDVDEAALAQAADRNPGAKTYTDYRALLDQNDVDAVVVATADHMHAWVTLAALRSGRHVYCEKPLAHSIEEARLVTRVARETGRVTQLGIQMHDEPNYRRVIELVRGGAIGRVSEVHVFVAASWGREAPAVRGAAAPAGLHWDTWLGAAEPRAYSPDYAPVNWRRWWAFGEGTLGDMGCHYMDLPVWALELGAPARVRAEGPVVHGEWCPAWTRVEYEFPERPASAGGRWPAVKVTWHDAGKRPGILAELKLEALTEGILFVGEGRQLVSNYTRHRLLPVKAFEGFRAPVEAVAASVGHYKEWVNACLDPRAPRPLANFDYGGPLTETVLLGDVAYRAGKEIVWDAGRMEAVGAPEAEQYIRLRYREGWRL